jgi:hypothetical protein
MQLTNQFTQALRAQIAAAPVIAQRPVPGFALLVRALWHWIAGLLAPASRPR